VQTASLLIGIGVGELAAIALACVGFPSRLLDAGVSKPRSARAVCAVVVGAAVGLATAVATGGPVGFLAGLVSGAALAVTIAFSRLLTPLSVMSFTRGLVVGWVGWLGMIWQLSRASRLPTDWFDVWAIGGIGVGTIAGIGAAAVARVRDRHAIDDDGPALAWHEWRPHVMTWLASGAAVAVASGLVFRLLAWSGRMWFVQRLALLTSWIAPTHMSIVSASLIFALACGTAGAMTAGVVGALVGLLGGMIGADVQRRAVPNQGIAQSAANIWRFALIGAIAVGLPYGVANVAASALITGVVPSAPDWIRLGLGSAVFLGLLGGLVPGAACLQHFALRVVLWQSGSAPWHYARFLDYATDRMLLQRVGGRYRFLHALLREHFTHRSDRPLVPAADARISESEARVSQT
jgi:hypothetical protein